MTVALVIYGGWMLQLGAVIALDVARGRRRPPT